MTVGYLQLHRGLKPQEITELRPFRCVVVAEEGITDEWMWVVSTWLVESGCLYMMAWGEKCSAWDDSVDYANLEQFNFGDIPDDDAVMTTWHSNEPLHEVFWFAKNCAYHPTVDLPNTLILHISSQDKESEMLAAYNKA